MHRRDRLRHDLVIGELLWSSRFAQAAEILAGAEADVTAYAAFPRAHHKKIASPTRRDAAQIGHLMGLPDRPDPCSVMHPILTTSPQLWTDLDRAHFDERGHAAGCDM